MHISLMHQHIHSSQTHTYIFPNAFSLSHTHTHTHTCMHVHTMFTSAKWALLSSTKYYIQSLCYVEKQYDVRVADKLQATKSFHKMSFIVNKISHTIFVLRRKTTHYDMRVADKLQVTKSFQQIRTVVQCMKPLMADHPDDRPPRWQTTLMTDHPDDRPP